MTFTELLRSLAAAPDPAAALSSALPLLDADALAQTTAILTAETRRRGLQ